jgi:hypothetical protein
MAEPNRLAAALSYEQDRPAFGNPSMMEQGRKMRERKQAEQVDRSAQNVKSDLLARALMYRYNPETLTGLTDTPGPQTLDEAAGLDSRVDRSTFLPYSKKEGLHVPAVAADLMKLATASNPQYSNLMQPEEAMPLATNMMGGGFVASRLAPAPAGSLGMNVISKRAFAAPQDEALRLAQQRAALPVEQHGLGLPAGNTPQQRAAAMAFENGFWHETSAKNAENLRSFSLAPSMAKAAASDELTPYAVFLKRHGKTINVAENPVQMPMAVNVGREFGFVDRPSLQNSLVSNGPNAKEIQTAIENTKFYDKKMASKFDEMFKRSDYDLDAGDKMLAQWELKNKENAAIAKQLITDRFNSPSSYGADTIRLLNDKGSMGRNVDTTMVMNPDNIRSRFAAFDPWRRNSALAAALGVAAPDLLAEEK